MFSKMLLFLKIGQEPRVEEHPCSWPHYINTSKDAETLHITHLDINFLSKLWKWRQRHIFFLIFRVSATMPTYSTASRAFSLVEERSVNTLRPLFVYAPLNTSVLYIEPTLQHKISCIL